MNRFKNTLAAFLMYFAAYIYMEIFMGAGLVSWNFENRMVRWLTVFTVFFVILTELIHWNRPRSRESVVWLGCIAIILLSLILQRNRVWGEWYSLLFLHIFAVWWVLSRSGCLLEGESGHLLLLDAMNGFLVFPLRHFLLRIRTVWYALIHLRRGKKEIKTEMVAWSVVAAFAAIVLFAVAVRLLMRADQGFDHFLTEMGSVFQIKWDINGELILIQFIFSLPVGAYLFGLIAGTEKEDRGELRKHGENAERVLGEMRKVPGTAWTVLTGAFSLLYLLFFILQARYLFGAFTRTLPEDFVVSQYARQGFFELCQVMAVNFVLLWLVTRSSRTPVRENRAAKTACLLLLAESMLFAVIAFSKLLLYIDCFGFTPLRLQSTWLVCVLFAGCVCAVYSLSTGEKSFRSWMMFGAISLSLLHLY